MMNEYNVVYAPSALDDLRSIYAYIAFELMAEQAAENQVNRIRAAIRKLNRYPEKHERLDWEPWMSMGMHRVPVGNYMVFYLVDKREMTVTVMRILYGKRDIASILMDT